MNQYWQKTVDIKLTEWTELFLIDVQ